MIGNENEDPSKESFRFSDNSDSSNSRLLVELMQAETETCFSFWCKNLAIPSDLKNETFSQGVKRKVSLQLGPKNSKKSKKIDVCDYTSRDSSMQTTLY